MLGRVLGWDVYQGIQVETALDPIAEPFLHDHEIEGVPVLPGVMGLEGFAEVARVFLPDYRVGAIEDTRFKAPLKYYRRQPRTGLFRAILHRESADSVCAELSLTSARFLATGEQTESSHFSGRVKLTSSQAKAVLVPSNSEQNKDYRPLSSQDIYRIYFHGPSFRVLENVEIGTNGLRGNFKCGLPAALRENAVTVLTPRLVELCFQVAGVWEITKTGRMALPSAIDQLVFYEVPAESASLHALVVPRWEGDALCFDARIVDAQGRVYLEMIGYRTSVLPSRLPEELLLPLQKAAPEKVA
jgi:hypothetical protein